jgi:UDP-N-acetyl-D-mannosaminuronic acid dehydrogenase
MTSRPSVRDGSIGIVGGAGRVGLPLGLALANCGLHVTLIDINEERLRTVKAGKMPFKENGAEELLHQALAKDLLHTSSSLADLARSEVVMVTIGTPVDEFLNPKITAFDRSMEEVLDHLQRGQLLLLRSTLYPGVTDRLANRVAERKLAIDIAYCPERIMEGFAFQELGAFPQIISGVTPAAVERAAALFRRLGAPLIEVRPMEAELAKLFSNAYRYINFAISNQLFMIAEKFGADFSRVHHAATSGYPRLKGFAMPGLTGGPCLLKDTMQLAAFNHNSFILGQAAMMVNEGMPSMLIDLAKARYPLAKMTSGILGMAFKGNSDDTRDSLAYKLRKLLTLESPRVLCTDPYVDASLVPLETVLEEADILFVGACHNEYKELLPKVPVIDAFHMYSTALR